MNRFYNQSPETAKKTLLHEIQHAIQEKEGWAKGGSPEMAALRYGVRTTPVQDAYSAAKGFYTIADRRGWGIDKAKDFFEQEGYPPEVSKLAQDILNSDSKERIISKAKEMQYRAGYDSYRSLAGEIEARDTAARMGLTGAERLSQQPYKGQGIPLKDVITKMGVAAPLGALLAEKLAEQRKREAAEAIEETYGPGELLSAIATGGAGWLAKLLSAASDAGLNYITSR